MILRFSAALVVCWFFNCWYSLHYYCFVTFRLRFEASHDAYHAFDRNFERLIEVDGQEVGSCGLRTSWATYLSRLGDDCLFPLNVVIDR
ncbi:hypothetical protein IWZ03DRAFT_390227 [Phyllosticta citriasiana]|uniref:Secreted protein n=1 Tax=Phyllosticta citriasiana TaxID=595635 RepID=A0ABR1K9F7_9PEZI